MGLKFLCHHCEHPMHVKDFLAGKRGKCPQCGGSIRIPGNGEERSLPISNDSKTESIVEAVAEPNIVAKQLEPVTEPVLPAKTSVVMPEVISEAPNAAWYVRPPSGGQYGPAIGSVFWDWLNEKRVGESSLVWREGWGTWQTAKDIFPDFFRPMVSSAASKPIPPPQPTTAPPTVAPAAFAPIAVNPAVTNPTTPVPSVISPSATKSDSTTLDISATDPTAETRRSVQVRRKKSHSKNLVLLVSLSVVALVMVVALVAVLMLQKSG
jgi:hypothetical protein